jgi:hypothetical protein
MEEAIQQLLLLRKADYAGHQKANGSTDKRCPPQWRFISYYKTKTAACNNLVKAREKMRLIREANKARN